MSDTTARATHRRQAADGSSATPSEAGKRYPDVEVLDDNHADALLVLAWALEEIGEAS